MKRIILLIIIITIQLSSKNIMANEFLNTFVHFNMLATPYSYVFGDITDEEDDSYSVVDYNGDTIRPSHVDYSFGASADIVPFPVFLLGNESHAIKFGIKITYKFHTMMQLIDYEKSKNSDSTYLRENFLIFETFMAGLVIHYAPFIKPSSFHGDYTSNYGFIFFITLGKINKGKLYPFAIKNTVEESTESPSTKVTGWKMDIGIGGRVSICSINIGLNLIYSKLSIEMDQNYYSNTSKATKIHMLGFELVLGFPLEWGTTKKQF